MIVGGRNNQVGDSMPLDIYDTDSSDWYKLPAIERFRHAAFMIDSNMYIHGGFDQVTPSVPTDQISKIDLNKAFKNYPALYKSLAYELGHDTITHDSNPKISSQRGSRKDIEQERHTYTGYNRREKMDVEQHYKRDIKTTNKPIRLCHQAVVANFD